MTWMILYSPPTNDLYLEEAKKEMEKEMGEGEEDENAEVIDERMWNEEDDKEDEVGRCRLLHPGLRAPPGFKSPGFKF